MGGKPVTLEMLLPEKFTHLSFRDLEAQITSHWEEAKKTQKHQTSIGLLTRLLQAVTGREGHSGLKVPKNHDCQGQRSAPGRIPIKQVKGKEMFQV